MILESVRYPLATNDGRTALLVVASAVVAIALGVRYAVALSPSVVALVPAAVAAVALVLIAGSLSNVLVDGADTPTRPVRSVARSGAVSLAVSVAYLSLPVVLLAMTVLAFVEAGPDPDDGTPVLFLVGSTVTLFTFLAVAYAVPAALAAAARDGRARAAVESDAVVPALLDTAYVLGWTVGFPLLVVGAGAISVTIGSGDVVGLAAAVVATYLLLAGVRVLGAGYDRATGSN